DPHLKPISLGHTQDILGSVVSLWLRVHPQRHRIVSALRCRQPDPPRQKKPTTQDVVRGVRVFCFNRTFARQGPQPRSNPMQQPSVYLKMRVPGAVDTALGRTRHQRVPHVAALTFLDEEGNPRRFTWRTIQTWYYRYKNHGITGMTNRSRKDKGQVRKVTPEELLEAINAAKPHFHNRRTNKRAWYRFCIEKGLLQPDRIAQTTFYRFIREYGLLAPEDKDHKKRLAFSMKYANQLWQADTMFGPSLDSGRGRKQAKLLAFIDDAS